MIPYLYPESIATFSPNPICALADCVSCTVTEERNGVYECEFKYPVNGPMFSEIKPGRIIGVTHDPSENPEPFDIYAMEFDLDGLATFRASHVSRRIKKVIVGHLPIDGYMNASLQQLTVWAQLNGTQDRRHNEPKYGSLTFSQNGYKNYNSSTADRKDKKRIIINNYNYTSLWDVVQGRSDSVSVQAEAEIEWQWLKCKFYKQRGSMTTAKIVYRSNLSSMRYEYDISGQCDAVIPYWVDSETKTQYLLPNLDSVARSYPYPAIAAPSYYDTVYVEDGTFYAVPVDFTNTFDTKPTADDLFDAATEYYHSNATSMPYENLTIQFAPLWDSPEYKYISDAEKLKLCDIATVVFPEYGLVRPMKLVKATWDCLLDRYTAMEFGSSTRTIYNVDAPGNTLAADTDVTYVDIDTDELGEGIEIGE